LLADADTAFHIGWSLLVGTDSLDPEVGETVLHIVLERLNQLLEFGKKLLPTESFSSLQIQDLGSFHMKARALLDCLHQEGIQLPLKFAYEHPLFCPGTEENSSPFGDDFWLPSGGLFHQDGISQDTALAFFQAGITDIDAEVDQITPLMNITPWEFMSCYMPESSARRRLIRFYGTVEFFVQKGGKLDKEIPYNCISGNHLPSGDNPKRYRTIHRIASSTLLRALISNSTEMLDIVRPLSSEIWRNILHSNVSDPCLCACANSGCRPVSVALKSVLEESYPNLTRGCQHLLSWHSLVNSVHMNWEKLLRPEYRETTAGFISGLADFLGGPASTQFIEDVIRSFTFSALGLTHTCCHHYFDSNMYNNNEGFEMIQTMEPEEVDEIREEKADMIRKLNSLVDKFMRDFQRLEVPLPRFLVEWWHGIMIQELQDKDEVPEEVREQLLGLGVKLQSDKDEDKHNDKEEQPNLVDLTWEKKKLEDKEYDEWMGEIRKALGC
jgi:hypothetical protein